MIPDFDSRGLLPKGLFRASWQEIEKRFGGNRRRRQLVKGLKSALDLLKEAGCRRVYIDGSFVTAKKLPNDIDVCWDVDGVDPISLDSVFLILVTVAQLKGPDSERNSFRHRRHSGSKHFWIFSRSTKSLEDPKA